MIMAEDMCLELSGLAPKGEGFVWKAAGRKLIRNTYIVMCGCVCVCVGVGVRCMCVCVCVWVL